MEMDNDDLTVAVSTLQTPPSPVTYAPPRFTPHRCVRAHRCPPSTVARGLTSLPSRRTSCPDRKMSLGFGDVSVDGEFSSSNRG